MIPKLAFLFLTIADIYHEPAWITFLQGHENKYTIYVHSKQELANESFFKPFELKKKKPTSWANTMRAQIELLRVALKDPANEKFIYVSESTIPLQSFDNIYQILTSHSQSMFSYIHSSHGRSFGTMTEHEIYKNAQWVILNRKHAQLMVEDRKIINAMTNDAHDQEHYPATFLAHHKLLQEVIKKDTTLAIWTGENANAHPHSFYSLEDDKQWSRLVKTIKNKRFFFARKFEKECDLLPLKAYLPWINSSL